MLTYTGSRTHFGDLINDTTSTTLTIGDRLINHQIKRILGKRNWPFLETTVPLTTVAGQQFYDLPITCKRAKTLYLTVGGTQYSPVQAPSREFWDKINSQTNYTSDIPEFFFPFNGQIGIWPVPATSSNIATLTCLRTQKDLTISDFSTGTILTATPGSATIIGTGTNWLNAMVGSYFKITEGLAGVYTDNKGDGRWYEIEDVVSGTEITLTKPYNGDAVATGAAVYTIGQASIIPEEYQDVPVIAAAYMYYKVIKPELDIAKEFKAEYDDRFAEFLSDYGQKTTSPVLDEEDDLDFINPNLTIRL